MKLVIFGATGRTGLPLVKEALAAGHHIVGFVRDPSKMPLTDENLTLVQGDMMNAPDVARAITNDVDAVISVIGPTKESPKEFMVTAANNVVLAMQQHNVERLIFMTGAGVDAPEDQPKLLNHLIKFALKTLAREVLEQSVAAVRVVQNSGLRWTVVRVPVLNDDAPSGHYRVGWVGVNTGARITRGDAATFLLTQLTSDEYVRKAPMISN